MRAERVRPYGQRAVLGSGRQKVGEQSGDLIAPLPLVGQLPDCLETVVEPLLLRGQETETGARFAQYPLRSLRGLADLGRVRSHPVAQLVFEDLLVQLLLRLGDPAGVARLDSEPGEHDQIQGGPPARVRVGRRPVAHGGGLRTAEGTQCRPVDACLAGVASSQLTVVQDVGMSVFLECHGDLFLPPAADGSCGQQQAGRRLTLAQCAQHIDDVRGFAVLHVVDDHQQRGGDLAQPGPVPGIGITDEESGVPVGAGQLVGEFRRQTCLPGPSHAVQQGDPGTRPKGVGRLEPVPEEVEFVPGVEVDGIVAGP